MMLREYFSQIETIIKDCFIVTDFSINFDEIDINLGYLKGTLELINGSILLFIEYVEIMNNIVYRQKYKYQWQFENGDMIIRWDNVPHHKEMDTFPHHMHNDKGVYPSSDMNLKSVIDIIMDKLIPF